MYDLLEVTFITLIFIPYYCHYLLLLIDK